MKKIMLLIMLLTLSLLTACGTKDNGKEVPKTDQEIYESLFSDAVEQFNDSESYRLDEESYYSYKLNGSQTVSASLNSSYEIIKAPFYAKNINEIDLSTLGAQVMKVLIEQDNERYHFYNKSDEGLESRTLTQEEFEEEIENKELNITLKILANKSVTKLSETKTNNQNFITYETTFKLADLAKADQVLLDNALAFYIDPTLTAKDYLNIDIKATIKLNASTKQLVEIVYDVDAILTKAFNDFITKHSLGWNITNTNSEYKFIFKSLNDVEKDTDFTNDIKY